MTILNGHLDGQARLIQIRNPSFEGQQEQGGINGRFSLKGWWDCGFKQESPPDIHDGKVHLDRNNLDTLIHSFEVRQKPFHGNTFLGMVVRGNNTFERISQKLSAPMISGQCYRFQIYLARSSDYKSGTSWSKAGSKKKFDFVDPCVLRLWGGSGFCNQKEMLAESKAVINKDWMMYEFHFKPSHDHNHFELEVYYKTPIAYYYNGNILLDKASNIIPVPCPPDELLFTSVVKNPSYQKAQKERKQEETVVVKSNSKLTDTTKDPIIVALDVRKAPKVKILKELSEGKLKKGQKIKIDKLYFDADSTTFDSSSEIVLDEIYDFLLANPEIKVEIGGHTNNQPKNSFCDTLSTRRARNVFIYLRGKGDIEKRITYKGYGKSEPIASNKSVMGRRKNQRVEIKIISLK